MKLNILITVILSLQLMTPITGQNISKEEIKNNNIEKIIRYHSLINYNSSTNLDLSLIDSSTIQSISEYDTLGRIIKNSIFYKPHLSTVESYNYTDTICRSITKNDSTNCILSSVIKFTPDIYFERKVALVCNEENLYLIYDKMITSRFLTQNVVLFDSSSVSKVTYYSYDSLNQLINLYSDDNQIQCQGQNVLLYDNSLKLIKVLTLNNKGEVLECNCFNLHLIDCKNDKLVVRINADNTIHRNDKNLEIQRFSKLHIGNKNASNVFTYVYKYRN